MKCVWPRIILLPWGISTRTVFKSISTPRVRISRMIRHYAAKGLQLLGLIVTGEALLNSFGDMGALLKFASLGAGLFYVGWFVQSRGNRSVTGVSILSKFIWCVWTRRNQPRCQNA